MTSKTLSTKTGISQLTRSYAIQHSWLFLLSFFVTFLSIILPLSLQVINVSQTSDDYTTNMTYDLTQNWLLIIGGILIAIINGVAVFKYLNSKSEVDLYHCLPIKRVQLFIPRFVVGLISYLIPLLINVAIFLIIVATNSKMHADFPAMISFTIQLILSFIAVFSFTAFATIITGNIFMAVCTSVGFMFTPTALFFSVIQIFYTFLDFYTLDTYDLERMIMYSNPMMAVSSYPNTFNIFGFYGYINSSVLSMIIIALQAVVMGVLAFVFFVKRPSENSSNPVAINGFKIIIKTIGVVCAILLSGAFLQQFIGGDYDVLGFILYGAIIGFIIHVAFEMLFALDIKEGLKNLKHLLVYFVITFGFVLCVDLDVINYSKRLEPIENIESIEYKGVSLSDERNIELLHNYMENSINNPDDIQYGHVKYASSDLKINLKNGMSYERNYGIFSFSESLIVEIESSEEYILSDFNYNLTGENFKMIEKASTNSDIKNEAISVYTFNATHYLAYDEFVEIYNAIIKDKDKLTPEYLAVNVPCVQLQVSQVSFHNDDSYVVISIPVYSIQEDAVSLLELKPVDTDDIYFSEYSFLKYKERKYEESSKSEELEILDGSLDERETVQEYAVYDDGVIAVYDEVLIAVSDEIIGEDTGRVGEEIKERVLEIMKPIYGVTDSNYSTYSNYGNSNQYLELIYISKGSNRGDRIGYLTYEQYESLIMDK